MLMLILCLGKGVGVTGFVKSFFSSTLGANLEIDIFGLATGIEAFDLSEVDGFANLVSSPFPF